MLLAGAAPPAKEMPDTITLQRAGSIGRITLRGTIREFTGRTLEFLPGSSAGLQSYPASEVVYFESPRVESHRRGLSEFEAGRVEAAAASFEEAMKEEQRPWMRREILAMSIRCALYRGDRVAAGIRFLALVQSDPDTPQFELIPLAWSAGRADPSAVTQAAGWLSHPTEVGRLVGASMLLQDPQQGAAAEKVLLQLGSSTDPRIFHLARAQQWRRSLKVPSLPQQEIERWQSRVDEMPERLRGGPMFVVAQGFLARGEKHRAAAAFLWLPLVYDLDANLAAEATLSAADALTDIGQQNAATMLYREGADRFRGTIAGDQAARKYEDIERAASNASQKPDRKDAAQSR